MKTVLIIEDSHTDTLLFEEAIRDCSIDVNVVIVSDWLDAQHRVLDPTLFLIMLDLNLPSINGRDIIHLIRKKGVLVPIIVCSTSSCPSDIYACYQEGANGYTIKPFDVDDLFITICRTLRWWLEVNKLWGEVYD